MAETPIVCLCGSTRFKAEFEEANRQFTREGRIVLAPGVFGHSGDPLTDDEKVRLDLLHFDKIDLAHQVYVVNPGGYIGESTAREVAYARHVGKPVLYLVPESHDDEFAPGDCTGAGDCDALNHIHGCFRMHRASECDSPEEHGHIPESHDLGCLSGEPCTAESACAECRRGD